MPTYEDKLTYLEMTAKALSHRCSCGGVLTVAWSPERNSHVLRCGRDITHDVLVLINNSAEVAEIRSKKVRGGLSAKVRHRNE